MKTTNAKTMAMAAAVICSAAVAQGQLVTNVISTTLPGGTGVIPDANVNGLVSSSGTVSGITGVISSISVSLDVTGGFNGDLYAYLTGPTGSFCVLLNRVGLATGNSVGYGNPGFNITLDDGAPDIHYYQTASPTYDNVSGQLTGDWSPDGRTIDPGHSLASAYDTADRSTSLSDFANTSPDGVWNLFVADLSPGGQSTLVTWGLTVVTAPAPEPQTWTLAVGGLGMLLAFNRRRKR